MLNLLVPFLLLTLQACVNTHLNCHYLYSQDILWTVLLSISVQPQVWSRSHKGCFIRNSYRRTCIAILPPAVWVILKPRILLSNSPTAQPHSAFSLGLKNASQTKGQFRLTLILPPWHSFSSVCLKFKACPVSSTLFRKSETEMHYWTSPALRRPAVVLCMSHSAFLVSGFRSFGCSLPPSLRPPLDFLNHAKELDIALVLQNASERWQSCQGKEFCLTNSSVILWRRQMILMSWRLTKEPSAFFKMCLFSISSNNNEVFNYLENKAHLHPSTLPLA